MILNCERRFGRTGGIEPPLDGRAQESQAANSVAAHAPWLLPVESSRPTPSRTSNKSQIWILP